MGRWPQRARSRTRNASAPDSPVRGTPGGPRCREGKGYHAIRRLMTGARRLRLHRPGVQPAFRLPFVKSLSSSSDNRFWSAFAIDGSWRELATACLRQLPREANEAVLGFLYVTDAVSGHLPDLLKFLRQATGIQDWTGSVGLGICTEHRALFERPGVALMVAALPPHSFQIFRLAFGTPDQYDPETASWIARSKPVRGIIHCDPRRANLD